MSLRAYEDVLIKDGYKFISGVDEVGRGPLVGPVVAACVILPPQFNDERINDSKKLSEKKRDLLYDLINEKALSIGIGMASVLEIDDINIYQASKLAMKRAIDNLDIKPDYLLIDAMPMDIDIESESIIKGDSKSISIAAASIIAKVTRDKMMYELHENYPEYGFDKHKGYPTKAHLEALNKYGVKDFYRKTYGPVKKKLESDK